MTAPGHRTSIIGTPAFVCRGPRVERHRYDLSRSFTRERQREAIAERDAERRRRALWLDCERAPLGIVEGFAA